MKQKKLAGVWSTALHLQKFNLATEQNNYFSQLVRTIFETIYQSLFVSTTFHSFFSRIIFFCSTSKNHSTNRDWKTTNLLFFVCILHCLLMTPLIITNLISIELPTEIYAILYAVYLLQYVVNFLIYALGHRQYRKAYVYFLQNVKLSSQ